MGTDDHLPLTAENIRLVLSLDEQYNRFQAPRPGSFGLQFDTYVGPPLPGGTERFRNTLSLVQGLASRAGATLEGVADPAERVRVLRRTTDERIRDLERSVASNPHAGAVAALARMRGLTDADLAAIEPFADEAAAQRRAAILRPRTDPTQIRPDDPDAREWLSGGNATLAANRFGDAETALAFVDELLAAGAMRVVVASDRIRDEGEEGFHADAVRVRLPAGKKKRRAVLDIVDREREEEGCDPLDDVGQKTAYLWWD